MPIASFSSLLIELSELSWSKNAPAASSTNLSPLDEYSAQTNLSILLALTMPTLPRARRRSSNEARFHIFKETAAGVLPMACASVCISSPLSSISLAGRARYKNSAARVSSLDQFFLRSATPIISLARCSLDKTRIIQVDGSYRSQSAHYQFAFATSRRSTGLKLCNANFAGADMTITACFYVSALI